MKNYNYKLIVTDEDGETLFSVETKSIESLEESIGKWERHIKIDDRKVRIIN